MPQREEHTEDLSEPWCQELLNSSETTPMPMDSQQYGGPTGPNENSVFAKTIATPETLRACVPLRRGAEVLVLLSFGTGLSSHSTFLAGGIICTLLDEILGVAASTRFPRNSAETFFTIEANIRFLKAVPAPGLALAKASIDRVDGRRLYAVGSLEDGKGTTFAVGRATYLKAKVGRL